MQLVKRGGVETLEMSLPKSFSKLHKSYSKYVVSLT